MSKHIFLNKPELDEKGLFFWEDELEGLKVITRTKKRPEELGFKKSFEQKIVVKKHVASTESLENEEIYFSMTLYYVIPQEARYKFLYLFQTKSGSVFTKDFTGGPFPSSQVDVNNPEFVTRSRAKKLPENTILKPNDPIYEVDPTTQELRRECVLRD